jgi:methylated-DNA-[protein]-cysteine S-methyltransferase
MHRLLGRYYRRVKLSIREASQGSAAKRALLAYFAGDFSAIASLPVVTSGTEFQTDVWNALRRIPRGQTLSYSALAKDIGRPAAVRAVGLANGSNPIAIIVPCHRVIGANTSLTGYAGGLERKRWLLDHEAAECG